MSIFEFLERLEVDPFDPELYTLFVKLDKQEDLKMKIEMNAELMDSMVRDWLADEGYIQDESGDYIRERIANEAWTDWQDVVIRESLTLDGEPFCDGGKWFQAAHDEEGRNYALTANGGSIDIV